MKIPKGWRKLRKGESIIKGDKFRSGVGWGRVNCLIGHKVSNHLVIIRKIKK